MLGSYFKITTLENIFQRQFDRFKLCLKCLFLIKIRFEMTMIIVIVLIMSMFIWSEVCISKNSSLSNKRCSNGPYYYEIIDDRMREGIGLMSWHMSSGLISAKAYELNYIVNPNWFDSEHLTRFDILFDFQLDSDCSFEDIQNNIQNFIFVDIYPQTINENKCIDHFAQDDSEIICQKFNELKNPKNFIKDIFKLRKSNNSVSEQMFRHWNKRGLHTVYKFHIKYGCINPVCHNMYLRMFYDSYIRKREYDKDKNIVRYEKPSNKFIIAYHLRWGDSEYDNHNNINDTFLEISLKKSINIINNILYNNKSILYNTNEYYIEFFSEILQERNEKRKSVGNISDFNLMTETFSNHSIRLHLDPAMYIRDFDIMANADILIIGKCSTFSNFIDSSVRIHENKLTIYPPRCGDIHWGNDNSVLTALANQICPYYQIDSIQKNCVQLGLIY